MFFLILIFAHMEYFANLARMLEYFFSCFDFAHFESFMYSCRYARDILQKEMLPHVGVEEYCETKKAYYFGYVHLL